MQGFPGMQGMPQGMGQGMPQGMGQGLENMDDASLLAMLQQLQGADQSTMPTELKDLLKSMRQGNGLAADDTFSEEITPEPGFVVKTVDLVTGRKVFVNMVGHPKVAAPGNWGGGLMPEEVQKALDNIDDLSNAQAEALRFPLSMSPQRGELDKKGDPVVVFDCCLHQDVIQMCGAHRPLKVFIIELALNWINHKHKTQLDPKHKLPRMRYKGDVVEVHRIRVDRKPLVTTVCEVQEDPVFPLVTKKLAPGQLWEKAVEMQQTAAAGGVKQGGAGSSSSKGWGGQQGLAGQAVGTGAPTVSAGPGPGSFRLLTPVQHIGKPVTSLGVEVEVPPALLARAVQLASSSAQGGWGTSEAQLMRLVGVEVCGGNLWVGSAGCGELHVSLPLAVDAQGASVVLDASAQPLPVLRLSLPYLSAARLVERAAALAPHAPGTLGLSSAAALELEP